MRKTMEEEDVWTPKICLKHGKLNVGGSWIHLPKLVAFLGSEHKDENVHAYISECDKCCKCGHNCECQ